MLVNRPCELAVELPRDEGQYGCKESNDDGDGDQVRLNDRPQQLAFNQVTRASLTIKGPHSLVDLGDLH